MAVMYHRILAVLALLPLVLAQDKADATESSQQPQSTDQSYYYDGTQTPDEAGASGTDTGAFSLSKGGLAAIIAIASIVAVLGATSLILWYVAKKRQWDVRQSLRRASRRFTGRLDDSKSRRQSRRSGVRMASPPRPKNRSASKEKDLEKGEKLLNLSKGAPKSTITNTFEFDGPPQKTWKSKLTPSTNKQ